MTRRRKRNKRLARALIESAGWVVCVRAGALVLLGQMFWQLVTQTAAPFRYPDPKTIRTTHVLHDLWAFYVETPTFLPATLIAGLLGIFVLAPLGIGLFRYTAQITVNVIPKALQLFEFYRPPARWLRSFGLKIQIEARVLLWVLLFCGPPLGALWFLETQGPVSLGAQLILYALFMAGMLAAVVLSGRYAAAEYFYAVQTSLTAGQAVRMSVDKMRGRLWEYFLFSLSFLLWELGAAMTMGLLYAYYWPYRSLAQIQFILDETPDRTRR